MENSSFTPADLIAILRRRWLLLVLPIVIGAPIALGVAAMLPPVYRATARILVESQQISQDLVRSTVGQSAEERIQLIQQRLLTRRNLLDIAAQHAVFANQPGLSSSEIVARMREASAIQGQLSRTGRGGSPVTSVSIAFSAENPVVAARVANEFVSRILAGNIEARSARATGTLEFFDREVARLAAELDAQAVRIARFKNENQASLPNSLSFRQTQLASLNDRVFTRDAQRLTLEQQRRQLQQALDTGVFADIPGQSLSREAQEVRRLQRVLVEQRAILAETHPSVRQLTARIAALERVAADATPGAVARDGDEIGVAPAPVDRMAEVRDSLEEVTRRIALLNDQEAADLRTIQRLEESIAATPATELALTALEREYQNLQVQYRDAVLKRAQAETGERLEAGQQAERFEVIEQAVTPEQPIAPNRRMIAVAGVAGSGALGVALMALAELLNRSIRTSRDMVRQLDMRPIVSIPYIRDAADLRRRRMATWALALALIIGAPLALFLIDRFVTPLPLLAARGLAAIGIDDLMRLMSNRFGG